MNRLKEVEEKMKQSQNEGSEQIMEKLESQVKEIKESSTAEL